MSAESSLLPQKGQAVPDLFLSYFLYNYPFIYKIITFSCIRFVISDIYAYLCRCYEETRNTLQNILSSNKKGNSQWN